MRLKKRALINASIILTLFSVSCEYTDEIEKLLKEPQNKTVSTEYTCFGIYLEDGTLLISDKDIKIYNKKEHKILLNEQGIAKWNSLINYDTTVNPARPVMEGGLYQKEFIIKLDDELIYEGKFWSLLSSASFSGIVIIDAVMPVDSTGHWIEIDNGYPAPISDVDLRSDSRVFDFFEAKGKLQ